MPQSSTFGVSWPPSFALCLPSGVNRHSKLEAVASELLSWGMGFLCFTAHFNGIKLGLEKLFLRKPRE